MEEQKQCKNCSYFLQHYVKHKNYILKVECGHCKKKLRKKYGELREACEYWTPIAVQKAEREEAIEKALRKMEKSLEEIKMILQSDRD